jgi:hypothetical protein
MYKRACNSQNRIAFWASVLSNAEFNVQIANTCQSYMIMTHWVDIPSKNQSNKWLRKKSSRKPALARAEKFIASVKRSSLAQDTAGVGACEVA